jgi:prepilin-type N-terminal cleavage/methylation domain-containing protein
MKRQGFTLAEVLVAVILIGIAIASLLAANISFTRANGAATNLSTAEFLLEQIRELTATLPVIDPDGGSTFGAEEGAMADYDDLDDFDGSTFSPPINADRTALTEFAGFRQNVTIENVSPANFQQVEPDHSTNFVRVTVTVSLNSKPLCSSMWIRARY